MCIRDRPINDGYPSWMKDNKGITYYSMPALDTDDVVILLEQSGVAAVSYTHLDVYKRQDYILSM